jgi:biotin transport system permease protein
MLTLTCSHDCWAHQKPAAIKLALLCGFTFVLFSLQSALALGLALGLVFGLVLSAGVAFARQSASMLRPLIPFIVVVGVWHLWWRDPSGFGILLRMITAVAAANFVTMTTRLSDMITVTERLARPFGRWIAPKTLALAIALTIRFIPTMLIRAGQIREGFAARSARRPGWRSIVPLALAALDDADCAAQALRARGGSD